MQSLTAPGVSLQGRPHSLVQLFGYQRFVASWKDLVPVSYFAGVEGVVEDYPHRSIGKQSWLGGHVSIAAV